MFRAFRVEISWRELIARTWREIDDDNCMGMAAQLAFYFILALFPALIVVVAIASFFPRSTLQEVLNALAPFTPPEALALIRTQLDAILAAEQSSLLTIGVLGALWSSSAALTAIIDTLNRAYDIDETRPWWKVRLLAIGLTVGLAVFILTAFALVVAGPEVAHALADRWGLASAVATAWTFAQWPIVFALVAFGVALTYYFAPDADQDWAFITPGSTLATVLWLIASLGFRFYVQNFSDYNATYGALGAAVLLLLWLYVSGLAVLIGAELNAEIEHASPQGKKPGLDRRLHLKAPVPGGISRMIIQTLIISSALIAATQAQTPPRATPETPAPPTAHAPAPKTDAAHKDHAAGLPAADAMFVKKAADGGMTEVAIGKLAQDKAENADVKSFAAKLVTDHSQANTDLRSLAASKNLTLVEAKSHGLVYAKLEKLSGAAFDRAFVAAMVDDHQKDVRAFEKVAKGSGDADVKAFAAKTLPTLKEHLTQVQDLSKTIGAKKPTS